MVSRFIVKSFRARKSRVGIAIFAVVVGSSVAASLLNVTHDIERKMNVELRSYGANLVLSPNPGRAQFLSGDDLAILKRLDHSDRIIGAAPFLYGIVTAGSHKVVLAGSVFDQVKQTNPFWQVEGEWIEKNDADGASMVGVTAADRLGLRIGDTFEVERSSDGWKKRLTVKGIVETGDAEDHQIFVQLKTAQETLGKDGQISVVLVSVVGGEVALGSVIDDIQKSSPLFDAKPIRKIAKSEANVLEKTKFLMVLVTLFALVVSSLCLMTTITALVVERQQEIGIMKALGAGGREITIMLLTELVIIGVLGGLLGYGVGFFFSQFIGKSVFGSTISLRPAIIPIVVLIGSLMSLLAGVLPIGRALAIEPVVVLRGE